VRRLRRGGCLLLVLSAAWLPACAPAGKKPETLEIVFWQSRPIAVVAPLVAGFERAHPGLRVRVERIAEPCGQERIRAALATGAGPDLCEIRSTGMPALLAGGLLVDWSAGVADLRPVLRGWELCSVGDALYGVPWVLETRVLFYDRALFARARLDSTRAPETWDQLLRAAAAIQRLGHGVHGYGVPAPERGVLARQVLPLLYANGGRILSDDLRHAVFDSSANVAALDFLLSLRRFGTMGRQESLEREFAQGRLGLLLAGAGLVGRIAKHAPGLRYGVALVPRPASAPGPGVSWAGGRLLVSFNAAKHRHEALELARFLVEPANALALSDAVGDAGPATVGADTSAAYAARPVEATFARQLATVRFAPNHPVWEAMEAAIEDEVEEALFDRKSAARAVQDAQATLAELVGKHRVPEVAR
jgi:multiple sugar transport system substrate-binding protein